MVKTQRTFNEEDGHQLAADMLREIREHWERKDCSGLTDDEVYELWRKEDSGVLRRYLDVVRRSRSPQLAHGFYAVITDYIASSRDGSVAIEVYEERSRHA